jgi:archaellum component FlaC
LAATIANITIHESSDFSLVESTAMETFRSDMEDVKGEVQEMKGDVHGIKGDFKGMKGNVQSFTN